MLLVSASTSFALGLTTGFVLPSQLSTTGFNQETDGTANTVYNLALDVVATGADLAG